MSIAIGAGAGSVIKSIQRGSGSATSSTNVTITAVDLNKSTNNVWTASSQWKGGGGSLSSGTNLAIGLPYAGGYTNIYYWEVVEYE